MQNILNLKNIILQIIFTTDLKRMPTWECYAIQLLIKQLTHESWNYQTSVKMFPRSTKCIVRVAPYIPLRSDFWMEIIGAPKVRYLHHYAVNKCMRRVCAREREVTCVSKVGETGGVCYWEALSRLPASNVTVAVCVCPLWAYVQPAAPRIIALGVGKAERGRRVAHPRRFSPHLTRQRALPLRFGWWFLSSAPLFAADLL